jgi:hypothetical protein
MEELVRARFGGGVEKNTSRAYAEATEGVEILDEPTHNPDGSPRGTTSVNSRPRKPRTTVKKAAAKKATTKKAASSTASTAKEKSQ